MIRGQIHWARLDKRRPVLLVSPTERNLRASDVIIVPCSTVRRLMSWHVPLRRGEAGLLDDSIAKCEQITTLHRSLVDPEALGGTLSPGRMRQVERAILAAIGVLLPV
jgi:mRNA-degrading endonuclease toxin of MazEF toxin-antitoxin module